MPDDKQQKRNAYMNQWKKEKKDRINVLFEKGTKERVAAAADYLNESAGEYVRKAVERRLSETESEMGKS